MTRWGTRGDVVRIERALFPGYLFARFDLEELPAVRRMRGLSQVLGPGNRPAALSDALMSRIAPRDGRPVARDARGVLRNLLRTAIA